MRITNSTGGKDLNRRLVRTQLKTEVFLLALELSIHLELTPVHWFPVVAEESVLDQPHHLIPFRQQPWLPAIVMDNRMLSTSTTCLLLHILLLLHHFLKHHKLPAISHSRICKHFINGRLLYSFSPSGLILVICSGGSATSQGQNVQAANVAPFPGCAAAMKCVTEEFCSVDGVMVNTPVQLSAYEKEYLRVPLMVYYLFSF